MPVPAVKLQNKLNVQRRKGGSVGDLFEDAIADAVERIDRVQAAKKTNYYGYMGRPQDFITRILGDQLTPDIEKVVQSVEENPITAVKSANATGKTHVAARLAVYWFKCHPDAQVWTGAAPPEENLKRLLWGEIGSVTEKHPEVFSGDSISLASMGITRGSQAGIYGVTIPTAGTEREREARFSGKHAPYILFIIDEADAVPPEVFRAIESCLSGGKARLLILFNPRQESGYVYNLIRSNGCKVVELTAFNHPNVLTGENLFPGAVDREKTVRRIHMWTESLPEGEAHTSDTFEVPPHLVGYVAKRNDGKPYKALKPGWRRIIEPEFSYMVLAKYPSLASGQLISKADVERAQARWLNFVALNGGKIPNMEIRPVMGQDVADMGEDWNFSCFRYGGFVAPLVGWRGVDPDKTADKATIYYKERGAVWANVDGNGVGAGVAPAMNRQGCNAFRIMVQSSATEEAANEKGEFERLRDQGWWALREWLRLDPTAMLPPDDMLRDELLAPTYQKNTRDKIKVSSNDAIKEKLPGHRSPDRASALMLTFCPQPPEEEPGELFLYNYYLPDEDLGRSPKVGLRM